MVVSGGVVRYTKRANDHAKLVYERALRSKDFLNVSKNIGFSIEQVQSIQNYLFRDYHYLNGNTMSERFDPSYEIAESWRRLSERNGRNIQKHDIILLYHELYEILLLLGDRNMSQATAHRLASEKYPYDAMSEDYYRERGQ